MSHEKKAGGDLSRDQDAAEPGPEEAKQEERPAEEAEEESDPTRAEASRPALDVLESESEPLQRGEAFDSPLGPLPKRSLAGMALMVAIGVAIYLLAWALFGGWGLVLGWIPAAALGFLAAREYGRSAEA